jgi:hypothetical protein
MMEEKGKITIEQKISKNPIVTIDTSLKDMLKWDSDGRIMDFDTSPEGFRTIPIDQLRELSFENKNRYMMAREIHRLEVEGQGGDWKQDIIITEQYASPSERIEVKNRQDGFEYYLSTPEKIGKHEANGFTVVPKNGKESIGVSGRNTIGTAGKEELVLMRTTKENAAVLRKKKAERNAFRKGNIGSEAKDIGSQNNIKTFDV